MKIIAFGDIHGRTNWKKIIANNDFDKVIFIGDYFDTHYDVSTEQQKENFKDIISFKKSNLDKVVLLFGNHDYHYLRTSNEQYSKFQQEEKTNIQELLHKAIDEDLLQMCYIHWNYLFVHAGVTKTWCKTNNIDEMNLSNSINDLFKYTPNAFRFTSGKNGSGWGDDVEQSPIWVRSRSLYMDKIPNYIQVVGHTVMDKITGLNGGINIYTEGRTIETSGVIFIDTLGTSEEYLEIIDGFVKAKK